MKSTPRCHRARCRRALAGSWILAAALAALTGCSDSPAGPREDDLTEAEIPGLIDALANVHAFDGAFDDQSPWLCPGGGRAVHAISTFIVFEPAQVQAAGTVEYQGCRAGAWILDGPLAISVEFDVDQFGRVIGASGTSVGTVQWERSGRRGECAIDLSVGFLQESVSVSGSACGRAIQGQLVD